MIQGKVLIIDDNRAARNALQEVFISRGWEVAMVTSQAEGLALLRDYDADWIVVPWEQLEGTGERFMTEVRARSSMPRVLLLVDTMNPVERAMSGRLRADLRLRMPVIPEDVFRACDPTWARSAVVG
jgi:DNA-binding response OmpR family regulator